EAPAHDGGRRLAHQAPAPRAVVWGRRHDQRVELEPCVGGLDRARGVGGDRARGRTPDSGSPRGPYPGPAHGGAGRGRRARGGGRPGAGRGAGPRPRAPPHPRALPTDERTPPRLRTACASTSAFCSAVASYAGDSATSISDSFARASTPSPAASMASRPTTAP